MGSSKLSGPGRNIVSVLGCFILQKVDPSTGLDYPSGSSSPCWMEHDLTFTLPLPLKCFIYLQYLCIFYLFVCHTYINTQRKKNTLGKWQEDLKETIGLMLSLLDLRIKMSIEC